MNNKKKYVAKYTRGSAVSPLPTIRRRIIKGPSAKTIESGKYKRLMIMCPACQEPYVLSGRERNEYLKKVARKGYKYGRPCSKTCADNLRNPKFRRENSIMPTVEHKRDLPNLPKPSKPRGKMKVTPTMMVPVAVKRQRDGAEVD